MSAPDVSVVIPTYRRPELVVGAVRSALEQTFEDLEVVVVVDGDCGRTRAVLAGLRDERLRVVVAGEQLGNGGARNRGIREARGAWLALLDDDDLWEPKKIERQLAVALDSKNRWPIVSCRLRARNEQREFVWPRRVPDPGEDLSEYLFCRRRPGTGEGMMQTSTLFAPTALFREVPFPTRMRRYVDLAWLLHAARVPGAGAEFVADVEPLATWRIDTGRPRVSTAAGWLWDVAWIRSMRSVVAPRARAAFLLTLASSRAARQRDRRALWFLLREARRHGRAGLAEIAYHLGNFAVPSLLHGRLAAAADVRPSQRAEASAAAIAQCSVPSSRTRT